MCIHAQGQNSPKPLRLRRYKTFSNFFEKSIDIRFPRVYIGYNERGTTKSGQTAKPGPAACTLKTESPDSGNLLGGETSLMRVKPNGERWTRETCKGVDTMVVDTIVCVVVAVLATDSLFRIVEKLEER